MDHSEKSNTNNQEPTHDPAFLYKRDFALKEIVFWIYHIVLICIGAIIIVYSYKLQTNLNNLTHTQAYQRASETVDLWGKGYVIDIKAVSTMNCPQGYEPLIEYQWNGTVEGCSCHANMGTYNYQVVLNGVCTSKLITNGCQRVLPQNEVPMSFWKGQKLLCIKRIDTLNFFNSEVQTSSVCSAGTDYQVYTFANVSCPITNLSNTSIAANSQTTLTLDSVNNVSFNYATNTGYPIAAFKLTEYQFCPGLYQLNISPNKQGNYILEPQTLTTCSGTDPRVKVIDTIDQQNLVNVNSDVQSEISYLPGYPRPSNVYTYQLGFYPYPTWKHSCRISNNLNLKIATSHFKLYDQTYISNNIFAFSIAAAVGIWLFRILYMVRRYKEIKIKSEFAKVLQQDKQIQENLPNVNLQHNPKFQIFLMCIDFGSRLGILAAYLFGSIRFDSYSLWYKLVFASGCTDSFLNSNLQIYQSAMDNNYSIFITLTIVLILTVTMDILFIVFRFKYYDIILRSTKINNEENEQNRQLQLIPEQSSKNPPEQKQLKVFGIQDLADQANPERLTNDNFYNPYAAEAELGLKKKKKKKILKKKNLFKKDNKAKEPEAAINFDDQFKPI